MTQPLDTMHVLVVDCQASHPDPQKGTLLEVAWGILTKYQIHDPLFERSAGTLVKPESDFELPRQVSRVTGITPDDLKMGMPVAEIWQKLMKASQRVIDAQNLDSCPSIIHYSRYEEPYLKHMHETLSPQNGFPLDIICTHKISQRLWPDLPRRGLRALAGYLGYSVGEFRRSMHHIEATGWIWRKIVEILISENGIRTYESLKSWLETSKKTGKAGQRTYPMAKEKRKNLPKTPGIYRMYRSNGDILYVGKATSLRQRVNSYFQKKTPHAEHKLEMLSQAVDLTVTETASALEAALLEADEIKRYAPPYNIALKTNKRHLVYSTKSYDSFSPILLSTHPTGPFPSPQPVRPISLLADLLSGTMKKQIDESICEQLLNVSAEYCPDLDCFTEGLEGFRDRFKGVLPNTVFPENLLNLATILHQEKLDLAVSEDELPEELDGLEEDDETEETVWEWTPELVGRHLEGVLRFGMHLIRRSRWFCNLSESVLVWASKAEDDPLYHMIILNEGRIKNRSEITGFRTIPLPPGFQTTFHQRKKNLDLMTYDRLRVLTTEIRRLVNENREVFLRLSQNNVLDTDKLRRRLQWC